MSNIFKKSKKAAILATVLGGCIFGSTVWAADLLIGIPSDYSTSQMGSLTGSRVKSEIWGVEEGIIRSLNRDPALLNVHVNGKSMALLRQYNYSTTNLIPNVLMDPNKWPEDYKWSDAEHDKDIITGVLNAVPNPHAACSSGNTIFATGYDLGKIGVVTVRDGAMVEQASKTVDLMEAIKEYTGKDYKAEDEKAWAHGEGLAIRGDYLYVLVSVNPHGSYVPYDDSYVLQFKVQDGGLQSMANDKKDAGYLRMGKNGMSGLDRSFYNDQIFSAFCGGMQNYGEANEETKISWGKVIGSELNPHNAGDVVLPEAVKNDGAEFRDMQILPNGTAYIFKYVLSGTSAGIDKPIIYKTTVSNLMAQNPEDWEVIEDYTGKIENGWFGGIFADYYTKRLYAEVGNNIFAYTNNGADPEMHWETKDFSTNKQHYQWNSVTMLQNDLVWGPRAGLGLEIAEGLTSPAISSAIIKNPNAELQNADYRNAITGTEADKKIFGEVSKDQINYKFTEDKTISLNKFTKGNVKNNILAGIDASQGNSINVDAGNNKVQLQVQNTLFTPVGIYAGQDKSVSIKAGTLNLITMGMDRKDGGNSLTNAIWADGGSNGSSITIDAPVNITMQGGLGGNGIAIQKTDRWGEDSHSAAEATKIAIKGDVTIKGADSSQWGIDLNDQMVLSRFNNAGLITTIDKGEIKVDGNVDLQVYGNGIVTLAEDSKISVEGGSIMAPLGMGYAYYTLGAYMGTINMNTGENGTTPGKETVKLDGDVFVLKDSGHLNLALTTKDSYLNGIVDNGNEANLYLQNDAQWINAATTTHYYQDNEDVGNGEKSHINNFYGGYNRQHAGNIFQTPNSKLLTIDNYSGSTNIFYGHTEEKPSEILGGEVIINHAEQGSDLVLKTNNVGIDIANDTQVNEVLNSLANKLYYTASTSGENNLEGKVEIVEGLTSQSATKKTGKIDYSSSNGQGYLNGLEEPEGTDTPGGGDEGGSGEEGGDTPIVRPDIVEPETVDMRNEADKHYVGKDSLAKNYIFGYDKQTEAIQGGRIYIDALYDEKANINIRIDAQDVDFEDNQAVIKSLESVLQQVVNEGENNVYISLEFTDGLEAGAEVLRKYSGNFKSVTANVGIRETINPNDINKGVYTTTITGNRDKDKAYAFNTAVGSEVEYQLADDFELRKIYTEANSDGIYAAIRPDGSVNSMTLLHSLMGYQKDSIKLNVDVQNLKSGGAYGIYNSHDGRIYIKNSGDKSSLEIKLKGAYDGAGIYSATDEGLSRIELGKELTGTSSDSRVLSIESIASRGNVEGIVAGRNSIINVNYGKLQINTSGDGLYAREGTINVQTYAYSGQGNAARAEENGVININNWSDAEWFNANYQDLNGDLSTDATGVINYNLRAAATPKGDYMENAHTTWTGNADGNINLTMDGGSTWMGNSLNNHTNLSLSEGSVWRTTGNTDNYIGSFKGSSEGKVGAIRQESTGILNIDEYSGSTVVIYEHTADKPTEFTGGDTIIKQASEGAEITLVTDNNGLQMGDSASIKEQELVNATLNALANKLYYQDYSKGVQNLSGKVVIAEGLTSSSASLRMEDITFDSSSGQGSYGGNKVVSYVDMRHQGDKSFAGADVVEQTFVYGYNQATESIEGGKLHLDKLTEGSAEITLRIDASDIDLHDNAQVNRIMDAALKQIDNSGENLVFVRFVVTDGLEENAEVLRYYTGSFSGVTGGVGIHDAINPNGIKVGVYTESITGNAAKDKAYNNNSNSGIYRINLADEFTLNNSYTQKAEDGLQAAVKLDGSNERVELIHSPLGGSKHEVLFNVDVSALDEAEAYGIYNNHGGSLYLNTDEDNSRVQLNITGAAGGAGIYSEGTEALHVMDLGKKPSHYSSSASLSVNELDSKGALEGIVAGKNAKINVNFGLLNINTKGTGLHATDGGEITTMSYGYTGQGNAAYAEKGGIITIQGWDDKRWFNAPYVDLTGDLKTDATGVINYELRAAPAPQGDYRDGAHTTWTGNADGNINLTMDGGSTWIGNSLDEHTSLQLSKGSVWETVGQENNIIGSFVGGSSVGTMSDTTVVTGKRIGAIKQSSTGSLTINEYSGSTAIIYEHNADKPQEFTGGETIVKQAAEGSSIALVTDNKGLNMSLEASAAEQQLVNATLNALANKLYYTGYTQGEQNLAGQVMIAEGLTSSSASMRVEDITFNEETGQGSYEYTPEEKPLPPAPPAVLTGPITGDSATHDAIYTDSGIWQAEDNSYNFKQDTAINTAKAGVKIEGKDVIIDAGEHKLTINTDTPSGQGMGSAAKGISVRGNSLLVKSATDINVKGDSLAVGIEVPGSGYGDNYMPVQGAPTKITFDKDLNVKVGLNGQDYESNGAVDYEIRGIYVGTKDSSLTVNGNTVVDVTSGNMTDAYGVVVEDREVGKVIGEQSAVINLQGAEITVKAGSETNHAYAAAAFAGKININTDGNEVGSNKVVLNGDLYAAAYESTSDWSGSKNRNGELNVALTTEDSVLNGVIDNRSSKTKEELELGSVNLWLQNGATWNHEVASYNNTAAYVNNSYVSNFVGGSAEHAGIIHQQSDRGIVIDNYSGNTKVFYEHDAEVPTNILGGNFTINHAEEGGGIILVTDNAGLKADSDNYLDKNAVSATLNALAGKLYYTDFVTGEENLNGQVMIAEGLLSRSVSMRVEDITFDEKTGQGGFVYTPEEEPEQPEPEDPDKPVDPDPDKPDPEDPDKPSNPEIIYGDSETAMMRGAKSAMASTAMIWRSENNDLLKRMGDLRINKGEQGIWAKYYGGKYSMNAQKANFDSSYDAVQVGYDKAVNEDWITGIAFSYNDGESKYALNGKGDSTVGSLGVYGTMTKEDGQYLDLILKRSKLDNEYTVYNDMGYKLEGDYDTWGTSFSAEFGKRFTKNNGFYIDPSVELTYGRIEGSNYAAKSDYAGGKLMQVAQDSFDSLIGRASLRLGYMDAKGSYYAKLGLAHEFSGDFTTTYAAEGEPTSGTAMDLSDTWYEIQIGGSVLLKENLSVYGSYERNFGADITQNWRIDAGLRFSF